MIRILSKVVIVNISKSSITKSFILMEAWFGSIHVGPHFGRIIWTCRVEWNSGKAWRDLVIIACPMVHLVTPIKYRQYTIIFFLRVRVSGKAAAYKQCQDE